MATVNFSIPEDVKNDFNETFAHENKSALVAQLLREAIEKARRKQQGHAAMDSILVRLQQRTPVSGDDIRQAREEGRH